MVFILRRQFGFSIGVALVAARALLPVQFLQSNVHRDLAHVLQNRTGKNAYATESRHERNAPFMKSPGRTSSGPSVETLRVKTSRRTEWVDITPEVNRCVTASGVSNGICQIYIPHTTAGITVNEGDDPDVARDMEAAFDRMVPRDAGYKHSEGNSDSHIKATMVGSSQSVWIEKGRLHLGRWQSIFFCEFDGPRNRDVMVKIVPDPSP